MTSPMINEDDLSPKPLPQIFNSFNNLTTKKEKFSVTPKLRQMPPPAPFKSISKISRLSFNNSHNTSTQKAQIISFKRDNQPELSKTYNETIQEPYFKQCFIIEEKIGSGSFGDVFKVKSHEDGKYYAVKVSREKFKGKGDREEKLNEVCKHEQLPNHDHLVKLYRAWEEKQRLYIQTELCSTSLSALAEKNHEISEDIIWRYLVDLLKAIDHLHSNDLIHLDIKPENIFISQDGKCKLGDFGLVFDVKNRGLVEATEGDPKYLASEVIQGTCTKAADIFSLGMTILELASDLDLPSRGHSWQLFRTVGAQIPDKIFQHMSRDLKSIILLMINPEYELRPTAKQLLNHPIVCKYEKARRFELQMKKCLSVFFYLKNAFLIFWSKVSMYLNELVLPLRNSMANIFPSRRSNDSNASSQTNASPIILSRASPNFNRAYVSNYIDQYSDDDANDNRLLSSSSCDSSFSNDEEIFQDNLSSRYLCSTVTRNNPNTVVSRLSPFFPSNHIVDNNAISMDSIKSVTQRLTFDDFSSDEMEMTENDEDDQSMQSSLVSSAKSSPDVSHLSQIRYRHNISRKNLAKTFDELSYDNSNT